MDDKLKALQQQEEETAVSSVASESESHEVAEQEGVILKSADVSTNKTGATQDCDNAPNQPTKSNVDRLISVASVTLLNGSSSVIKLEIKNIFSGEIYAEIKYEALSPNTIKNVLQKMEACFVTGKNCLMI